MCYTTTASFTSGPTFSSLDLKISLRAVLRCSFQPDADPKATQECSFISATTWFATRPDFQVSAPLTELRTEPGGEGDEAEEWQLL